MSNNKYSDKDMQSDGTIDGMCNCSTCKDERRRGVGLGMQNLPDPPSPPSDSYPLSSALPSAESLPKLPENKRPRMLPRAPKEAFEISVEKSPHYQFGENGEYEVFRVLDAWGLWDDAALFNVIKYVARASHKGRFLEDLKKARVYLDRRIKMEEGDI